jgi:hypothetical protein
MSLKELFQQKVPETFAFVKENYGFEFENISDYLIVGRKQNMNIYFRFDRGISFGVAIEVTGELGEKAIADPRYRRLGASTMAECIDKEYKLRVKRIKNKKDLLDRISEEARVLKKYFGEILNGDVSKWEQIVDCLLNQ